MPLEPGKYELEAELLKRLTLAQGGVFIIVSGGEKSDGFAVRGTFEFAVQLPKALREIADVLEKDIKRRIS